MIWKDIMGKQYDSVNGGIAMLISGFTNCDVREKVLDKSAAAQAPVASKTKGHLQQTEGVGAGLGIWG